MNKLFQLVFISLLFFSCSDKEKKNSIDPQNTIETKNTIDAQNTLVKKDKNSTIVTDFLKDINSLQEVKDPINQFQIEATKSALKSINLTKENVKEVLKEAEKYTFLVIIVENHTIVKVTDISNCQDSGSWACCMPYATGFIKRGNLEYKEDYCNNIIGVPGTQKRVAYFFN